MLFQKLRPFALASLLLLVCGALALAQPNNPPAFPNNPNNAAVPAGAFAFVCACWAIAALVWIALVVAICMFVYKDAKARGADPMLWLILCIFTNWIGLVIWLIVRPPLGGAPRD